MFKKELYVTTSLEKVDRLRNLLRNQGIDYRVRVSDQDGPESSFFSMFFVSSRCTQRNIGMKDTKIYYVYVSRKDLEVAQLLLNQIR